MHQIDRSPAALPVLVCRGADCRGAAQERLCESLGKAGVDVVIVGCLGVCQGPVAMCPIGDRWKVVAKVKGEAGRECVLQALCDQRAGGLKARAVKGKRRRKAIAKAASKLARRNLPTPTD